MKILILCTGNSCRSQMAHGFLQSFDKNIQVYSAGTHPAEKVNPLNCLNVLVTANFLGNMFVLLQTIIGL